MPFKTTGKQHNPELSVANVAGIVAAGNAAINKTEYYWLLMVVAECFNSAARGENAWISVGKNRNGDSFLLTLHVGADVLYAGGMSLVELAGQCRTLLEGPEKL